MIELKGLCKSFEEKEVLKDINATFEKWKDQPDYRAERFGKNRTHEMYRGSADTRQRRTVV